MPVASIDSMRLAIKNVAMHGDTDVFPYPIDNHIFHDLDGPTLDLLSEIDADFPAATTKMPILGATDLAVAGYNGFRQATQIDPIWNLYLLSLVLTIAADIEQRRVHSDIVFSYRFSPDVDNGWLFRRDVGWRQYQEKAVEKSQGADFVLKCDISDFYPRIYHHRLENALKQATDNAEAVARIMAILKELSGKVSYGLPVGGPAARLLSELLLNRVDRLLLAESVTFCRFVDDYVIFAQDRQRAHSALIALNTLLLTNEGLSLQKAKTKLMSGREFRSTSDFTVEEDPEGGEDEDVRAFKRLRLHFDPYSPTAADEYAELRAELDRFDIVGMLGRELLKSRVDESLTRRLISAVRHLDPPVQSDAIRSMLGSLDLLYPVFPSVMLLCRNLLDVLEPEVRNDVFETLRKLIATGSYIVQVPANLSFALRVLVHDDSEEAEVQLSTLYKSSVSMMIKRDLILTMAHRHADHWISNVRRSFGTMSAWERRALLVASYILGDEGAHWRASIKRDLSAYEVLTLDWAAASKQKNAAAWRVPV